MRRVLVAVAGLALLVAGCARPSTAPPSAAPPSATPGERYRVSGTVLESPQHGPQLCRVVATSYPPQCGGPDVEGWSWDAVRHESANGVRWGTYTVTGSFDGTAFTLDRPAAASDPAAPPAEDVDFTSPCPAPAGGWRPVDRAKATDGAFEAVGVRAAAMPGYAGLWIDQNGGENDPGRFVVNIRFTGDPAARQAALRKVWGGALCLLPAQRSQAQLDRVKAALSTGDALQASVDVLNNRVDLLTYVATEARQRELDTRYGAGVVRLTGWLTPI